MRIAAAILMLAAASAQAAPDFTGQVLLDRFRGPPEQFSNALGYVAGVGDVIGYQGIICVKPGTTVSTNAGIVMEFLTTTPSRNLKLEAHVLVAGALIRAWPCHGTKTVAEARP